MTCVIRGVCTHSLCDKGSVHTICCNIASSYSLTEFLHTCAQFMRSKFEEKEELHLELHCMTKTNSKLFPKKSSELAQSSELAPSESAEHPCKLHLFISFSLTKFMEDDSVQPRL